MALKIWTFLLVMSLPAAEHGRSFGSFAAVVLGNIDYHKIQHKLFSPNGIGDDDGKIIPPAVPPAFPPILWWTGHRVDKRAAPKITNKNPFAAAASSVTPSADSRCMARVQSALGDMMSSATGTKNGNRRHTAVPQPPSGVMDLSGYALHQRLRTAPGAEMYVTGMRAKVMPLRDAAASESSNGGDTGGFSGGTSGDRSWARVDGCRYDPLGNTLEARMRFGSTLMVSGSVRLLYGGGGGGIGETGCDMTLRLRPRAGLGFTAAPLTVPEKSPPNRLTAMPTMTIRTTATFIDPEPADDPAAAYVSVHSYNCVGGAAGFPGNRERPVVTAASSDRYEQFLSSELGGGISDELLLSAGGDGDVDVDDGGAESGGSSDERSGRRPSSPPPSSSSSASDETAPADNPSVTDNFPFVSAGFVNPPAPSPEPRLRRIQYHNKLPQHPLLTIATGPAATNNPHHQQAQDQLLMEMEDVFVRGVRSLLAKHMERTLKPVLKDSLMANMGYTVSYG